MCFDGWPCRDKWRAAKIGLIALSDWLNAPGRGLHRAVDCVRAVGYSLRAAVPEQADVSDGEGRGETTALGR